MNTIDLCLKIATEAHRGQLDKAGVPYILHPLSVGLMGDTDEERMAGFLHDVVEDTDWTVEQLTEAGVPEGVVGAVELLTHHKDETDYLHYIRQIIDSRNPIALAVKRNDLRHNLSRSHGLEWAERKYTPALQIVEKSWAERNQVTLYEPATDHEIAYFACGCFWGVQHMFARQKGVLKTMVGYTGGQYPHPTYAQVRSHQTDHVEAVAVEYDPSQTDYRALCQFFFEIHDPAQTDGQGEDIGPQYRSALFTVDETQRATAEEVVADLRSRGYEVNTLMLSPTSFWIAEELHQDYYDHTGGSPYCHVRQKKF